MSPDNLLHKFLIRYDQYAGFGTTDAAEIVRALQTLNATRSLDTETGQLVDKRYFTPDWQARPHVTGISDNEFLVKAATKAEEAYLKALKTGNLDVVYAALDALNHIKMAKGGEAPQIAFTDFEILAEGKGVVAMIARTIASQRIALREDPEAQQAIAEGRFQGTNTLPAHGIIPPFDTVEFYAEFRDYRF